MFIYTRYRFGNKIQSDHESITDAIALSFVEHEYEESSFSDISLKGVVVIDRKQILNEWSAIDDD